ncbi:MAG TPA: G5 domain-containing protein [Candidatus Dojkabacteria bacterium]|nr:G5 domain-containing protein [Candidatus Dojkabacteria bacterium]HNW23304.1 G5 domain-containing protein [Candidatus Dojkabacteria bacterium]
MNTDIYDKKNKKAFLIPLISLLLFGFLFSFLLSISNRYVYAQQDKYLPQENSNEFYFFPNQKLPKISHGLKLITIEKDHNTYTLLTKSPDVFQILREANISIDKKDVVTLSTQYVQDGTIISVIRTDKIVVLKFVDIPYKTETVENNLYIKGEKHIKQKGTNGVMKQRLMNTYENGYLISSVLISETIDREPVNEIVELGTSDYLLQDIEKRGYNCPFWYSVVDSGPYSDEEKRWLKFIMYCESGCNAESDKGTYKGLFQWSPYWWKKQFPENIFDGYAQLKHTIEKYRAGEKTRASQWPACHARYVSQYGSN